MKALPGNGSTDRRNRKPFLQPLALGLVCGVLIALLVMVRWMDLNAIDHTLTRYMEDGGLSVIKNLERVSDAYRQQLLQADQAALEIASLPTATDETSSLQESFVFDLLESARNLDVQLGTGPYQNRDLDALAQREGLWLLAVLDREGRLVANNKPLPGNVMELALAMTKGEGAIRLELFGPFRGKTTPRSMVIRRKSGAGFLIIAMDDASFQRRLLHFSIHRALQDLALMASVQYLALVDGHGRILVQVGEVPETKRRGDVFEALPGSEADYMSRKVRHEGRKYLEISSPFRVADKVTGLVRLGLSWEGPERILRKNRRDIFVSMGFIVLITVLAMWLLYQTQNKHVARTREMEKRMEHAERLSALGRLAAGVAHEIRNPLNAISMAAQRLDKENVTQLKGVIREEIRRLNGIVEDFLGFAKSKQQGFQRHDLTGVLKEIVVLYEEEARTRGATIEFKGRDGPVFTRMDSDKLKQALVNLVKNAIESVSPGGTIAITLDTEKPGWISARIADTGPGLTPGELEHIFDLDYTTKQKGLGLGLPLAREIIKAHGGEINVKSSPGHGTTFKVSLPLD
ncbi:MAG: hypothetical protein JRH06_06470 [Deltaproteobacteria bacterium]|nr:hypothetical protein [Deltaproteobacteria bacterium]MBW2137183.1 hypothetical protein [Deltaproteobacteria bacterium]